MLLGGKAVALVLQHLQSANQPWASFRWVYHVVNVPSVSSHVGVGEFLLVIVYKLLTGARRVFGGSDLLPVDYVDRPSAPITAISADGHTRLMSERRCLLLITMYAPP